MTIQEKKSPPKRPPIPADVIDVEPARSRWSGEDEEEATEAETPGTELVISKKTEFEENIEKWSREAKKGSQSTVEELDTSNKRDAQIAKVTGEDVGDLIDIARLGGRLTDKFCIAPIKYSGQHVRRRWHVADGDMYYFIGRSVRINRWSMYFEPGTVIGPQGGERKNQWRESELPIPHVPAQFRAGVSDPRFLVWAQSWDSNILLPTNPVVLDHVAGDVYRMVGGWQFSDLEVAAMRKAR